MDVTINLLYLWASHWNLYRKQRILPHLPPKTVVPQKCPRLLVPARLTATLFHQLHPQRPHRLQRKQIFPRWSPTIPHSSSTPSSSSPTPLGWFGVWERNSKKDDLSPGRNCPRPPPPGRGKGQRTQVPILARPCLTAAAAAAVWILTDTSTWERPRLPSAWQSWWGSSSPAGCRSSLSTSWRRFWTRSSYLVDSTIS